MPERAPIPMPVSMVPALVQARAPKAGCLSVMQVVGEALIACVHSPVEFRRCWILPEVLLLTWSYDTRPIYHVVEYFAGAGKVSEAFRREGYNVASYDYLYNDKGMEFLQPRSPWDYTSTPRTAAPGHGYREGPHAGMRSMHLRGQRSPGCKMATS